MKELSAANDTEPEVECDADSPVPDLQSLVDGIAALDRFDSVLAEFARSLGSSDRNLES